MEDEENHYDKELYTTLVHAFFLEYHEIRAYHWWLSFHPTDLERYREFKVSTEGVMFYAHSFISFVLMDILLKLWCAHQASMNKAPGLSLTIGLMGELVENAKLGHKVPAEGFKGPAFDLFLQGQNAE
jgi:hypothetical protein